MSILRLNNFVAIAAIFASLTAACSARPTLPEPELRGTGDLGIVVERATGSVIVIDTTAQSPLGRIKGLGDLSHASAVFSRDGRYVFVFGRDGGLSKLDLLRRELVARTIQAGNAIGGAISQDGKVVAVSNYDPGGIRLFDAATLAPLADLPAGSADARSKVVGLVDAPGRRFVASLFDAGEIWIVDATNPNLPDVTRLTNIGKNPYDALITPDGRFYLAGLFGEDGIAKVDLWQQELRAETILPNYGKGEQRLPVYKMPHMEGWAEAGGRLFLPAVGRHELLVVASDTWQEAGRVALAGQPIFAIARPDGRYIWVNFSLPHNDRIQIVDTQTLTIVRELEPGPGVLHMEFTPRGEHVWVSLRDADVVKVYDTETFAELASFPAATPSGIFMTWRAGRIGL